VATALGRLPSDIIVDLQRGFGFSLTLQMQDGSTFPSAPTLTWSNGDVWTATVTGPTATFSVTAAQVSRIPHHSYVELAWGDQMQGRGHARQDGVRASSAMPWIVTTGNQTVFVQAAVKGDKGDPSTVPGPQGAPGGSDSATASWLATGMETKAALRDARSAAIAPQVEGQPLWVTGHSWVAGLTDAVQWWERVSKRIAAPTTTTAGYSGRTIGDVALAALSGTGSWTPRTASLVMAVCTINDITIFQGTTASRAGYKHAWRSLLSLVTSNYVTAADTAQIVYSSGWTKQTIGRSIGAGSSTNATGSAQFKTTTTGSYLEFAATGPSVDVVLMARTTGAGLATATVAGTTVGTLDLTAATAQDTPAVMKLRNLGAGTRTIRVTHTSGASLTLDSIRIPATTPTEGVIVGEPPITSTNYPAYLTDLASFKADLAAIVAEYPTFVWLDLAQRSGFTASTHLYDGKHPSDPGADWIAAGVVNASAALPWVPILHRLATSAEAAYTEPTPPAVPSGGQPGAGPVPPIMTDTPPYTGTTDTGAMTWASITGGTPAHTYNTVESSQANVIVKATLSAIDPDAAPGQVCAGIACRVSDIDNGIMLSVRTDTYAFTRFNAGTHGTLNATSGVVPVVGDVLELRTSGTIVQCWVNGVKIMEHTTLTANQLATKHGFMTTTLTDGTTFSDISITPN
jgi:hypothetical protein